MIATSRPRLAWAGALLAWLCCAPACAPEGDLDARARRALGAMAAGAADRLPAALPRLVPSTASTAPELGPATAVPDGTLVGRVRLGTVGGAALDLVAHTSGGLVVTGLLCYPDDGLRHPAVVHVHGGLTGVFADAGGGTVMACVDWAASFGKAAFVPSLRGQDGGEGRIELCLGEADDVAAGTLMLRSLEVADPARVALVGASLGACVVLRAAPKIPDLAAVVAFAPPSDWRELAAWHRAGWAPASETLCDGTVRTWSDGGPAFADLIDAYVCGHPFCPDADYQARSTLPGAPTQSAPTLVAVAGADNLVPAAQQAMYHALRQSLGHPVSVQVADVCGPWGVPAPAQDVLLLAPAAFHQMSPNVISTGLLFLMQQLDAAAPLASR